MVTKIDCALGHAVSAQAENLVLRTAVAMLVKEIALLKGDPDFGGRFSARIQGYVDFAARAADEPCSTVPMLMSIAAENVALAIEAAA